jgi:hypothetical protein
MSVRDVGSVFIASAPEEEARLQAPLVDHDHERDRVR